MDLRAGAAFLKIKEMTNYPHVCVLHDPTKPKENEPKKETISEVAKETSVEATTPPPTKKRRGRPRKNN
jgi:hypothetical protein